VHCRCSHTRVGDRPALSNSSNFVQNLQQPYDGRNKGCCHYIGTRHATCATGVHRVIRSEQACRRGFQCLQFSQRRRLPANHCQPQAREPCTRISFASFLGRSRGGREQRQVPRFLLLVPCPHRMSSDVLPVSRLSWISAIPGPNEERGTGRRL